MITLASGTQNYSGAETTVLGNIVGQWTQEVATSVSEERLLAFDFCRGTPSPS